MDLIQQKLGSQFDRFRELEGRAGIAQSHDNEILIAVGSIACRTGLPFHLALSSLSLELKVLAADQITESEGGDHD